MLVTLERVLSVVLLIGLSLCRFGIENAAREAKRALSGSRWHQSAN